MPQKSPNLALARAFIERFKVPADLTTPTMIRVDLFDQFAMEHGEIPPGASQGDVVNGRQHCMKKLNRAGTSTVWADDGSKPFKIECRTPGQMYQVVNITAAVQHVSTSVPRDMLQLMASVTQQLERLEKVMEHAGEMSDGMRQQMELTNETVNEMAESLRVHAKAAERKFANINRRIDALIQDGRLALLPSLSGDEVDQHRH